MIRSASAVREHQVVRIGAFWPALPSTIFLKRDESDETIEYEPNPAYHPHRADRWRSSLMAL